MIYNNQIYVQFKPITNTIMTNNIHFFLSCLNNRLNKYKKLSANIVLL